MVKNTVAAGVACALIGALATPAATYAAPRQPVTPLGSLVQLSGKSGCLVDRSAATSRCTTVRALKGPAPFLGSEAVSLSPDGRHLYVASSSSNAIAIFRRSAATGKLTQASGRAGCVATRGAGGCARGLGLLGPNSVAVSPDGRNVYATSLKSDAVSVFRRDRVTGALTQLKSGQACVSGSPVTGCATGRALKGPDVVRVSPDGRNVYVGSFLGNALVVFARNASTGALKQPSGTAGCVVAVAASGCGTANALGAPEGLAVSKDGDNVYIANAATNAVGVYSRNASTGALKQASGTAGCIGDTPVAGSPPAGCAGGVQLSGANAVVVSPDDADVYVTSLLSNSVTSFSRGSKGHLTQKSGTSACLVYLLAVGCSLGRTMEAPEGLAVSPDGENVYVAAFTSNAVDVLNRSVDTGALLQKSRQPGCITVKAIPDCQLGRALVGVSSFAISPDGRYVYAAAFASDAVTVFKRVTPPSPPNGLG
jgi:DNA-binding beta-propeller fold protein YncE